MGTDTEITAKRDPCGTQTVRLRDLPLSTRLKAARSCMANTGSDTESTNLFLTALHPEDAGGRVTDTEWFWNERTAAA